MEEIPEPGEGPWPKAGTPFAPKRLPGFNLLAWLAVIAAAGCLQLFRSVADRARAAGMPWSGTDLDTLAVVGAVSLAVAAVAVVLSRKS